MNRFFLLWIAAMFAMPPLAGQDTLPWSQQMANSQMLRSGNISSWDYPNGLFAESVLQVYNYYRKEQYLTYVVKHAGSTVSASTGKIGSRYNFGDFTLDNVNPGMFLIGLHQTAPKPSYKIALDTLRKQLAVQPRTNDHPDGGFWHKKIYPHQMWLDGLYMGARFYAEYERLYNQGKGYDDIVNQFVLIHRKTYDPEYQLNYHAWSAMPGEPSSFWANRSGPYEGCSKEFWGRGLGWYAAALADVIEILPASYGRREELVVLFNQVAAGIRRWQDSASGCWFQLLRYDQTFTSAKGRPNYLEASASSMFTYALMKALRLGIVDASLYKPVAEKAYQGLITNFVSRDGAGNISLNRICRSAGLGPASNPGRDGSASYYLDGSDAGSIVSNDLKGVGPFILASVEYERLQHQGTGLVLPEKEEKKVRVRYERGNLTVESSAQTIREVRCFDVQGKLVAMEKGNEENRFRFPFRAPAGFYLVTVNNGLPAKLSIQ